MAMTGLYRFCANRGSTRVIQRKSSEFEPESKLTTCRQSEAIDQTIRQKSPKKDPAAGRKVMVVADSREGARAALQWCLSHAVQRNDTLVLLHHVQPCKLGESSSKLLSLRTYKHLTAMKNICQSKRPEVKVETLIRQAGSKQHGPAIVEAAKKEEVSLLVLGQHKPAMAWQLLTAWNCRRGRSSRGSKLVEYCIQNAPCMTLGVRRKGRKSGGYLITTKRHKNFWLLA